VFDSRVIRTNEVEIVVSGGEKFKRSFSGERQQSIQLAEKNREGQICVLVLAGGGR